MKDLHRNIFFLSKNKFFLNFMFLLALIILVEGFVSVAIEILAIRQLLPVAGGSVIVTSLIIGIFLLFLAIGYKRGGILTDNLTVKLRKNFILSAIGLGVGLSYFFILIFFYYIQKISGPHIIYPLIAYLLLVIAPLIYILGQTLPITMNMAKQNKSVGQIGGDTLGLSTIGSFLGATFTALILMQYFGVAATVVINCALLLALAIALSKTYREILISSIFSFFILWFVFILNVKMEQANFVMTNNYANYQILNSVSNEKILVINNLYSSRLDQHNKGFPYIERIKKILFQDMKLANAEILVLGAGGFTLSAENSFGNHFTYVDIDSHIKNVAMPRFIRQINGEFIADDARHYLQISNKKYDVIIVDAYSNLKALPTQLSTREYMRDVKMRLAIDGIAIFNIIANPMLVDAYSKCIDNTIRGTFKNCMVIPERYSNQITNILYVCRNASNQNDNRTYTDNLNTATTDSFEW